MTGGFGRRGSWRRGGGGSGGGGGGGGGGVWVAMIAANVDNNTVMRQSHCLTRANQSRR